MSEELQSLVQIMELYGKGLAGLGKAIKFSAESVGKGVRLADVKLMQRRMRLHYASVGNRNTMRLADLEKLTGGQYNILNIPMEDDAGLTEFYNRLKKLKVSFAELPDLELGDGYTQIAYNPMDADRVKIVVDYYRKKNRGEAKDMSFEEYMATGGERADDYLAELAEKGYIDNMNIEQLEEIKERVESTEYYPISVNVDSLMLEEKDDHFIFRVPRSEKNSATEHAFMIPKSEMIFMDQGQTVITAIPCDEIVRMYDIDQAGNIIMDSYAEVKASEFYEHFKEISNERMDAILRLRPDQTEIFPSFIRGQESNEVLAPDADVKPLSKDEETVGNVLSFESIKEKRNSPDYLSVQFDLETQMVAETKHIYALTLPTDTDEENLVRCITIGKENTLLSEDGKRLVAYLKKSEMSSVMEFNSDGEKIKDLKVPNLDIVKDYMKKAREGGVATFTKDLSKDMKRVSEAIGSIGKKV